MQKEDLKVPIVISIAFSLVIRIYLFYFSDKDQPDFAKKLRLGKLDAQDIAIPNKKYPVKLVNPVCINEVSDKKFRRIFNISNQ